MSSAQPVENNNPRKYQLLIDGQWVDAESGKTFTTPNPATGETLAEVAEADKADIDKAVAAARRAYEGKWSKMSARDRGRLALQALAIDRRTQRRVGCARNCRQRQANQGIDCTLICRRSLKTLNTSPVGPRRSKAKRFRFRARCSTTHCVNRWCLRSDHSLEFSVADGCVETRAGAGGRQHGGLETC